MNMRITFMYAVTAIVMIFLAATSAMAEMPEQFNVILDVSPDGDSVRNEWTVVGAEPMPEAKIEIVDENTTFATWTEAGYYHESSWSAIGPKIDPMNAVITFTLTVPSKEEMHLRFPQLWSAVEQEKPMIWFCETKVIGENSWWLTCTIDK